MQSVLSIIQAVEDALGQHATLRKLALQSRRLFARDLALIALSCRCAWLVDTVAVQNPARVFTDLLVALREKHAIFHAVLHLLEPSSEQSFFVNTHWLARQPDHPTDVAFVLLPQDADPQYLSDPPPDVLAALRDLAAQSSDTPSTALALPLRTAIPFAGVLLGYPVAYVPAAPAPAFLAHTLLDVYVCAVRGPGWEHTLLKFSCPALLAATHPARLAPTRVVAALAARFEPRVRELGLALDVSHSTVLMDRVAL